MNYFEFYDLPISFKLDVAALRRQFLSLSKKYHPDFYTLESEAKQAEILELSTMNNEAYKLLKDQEKRIKYVLELKGLLGKDTQPNLSQAFLLDMMDINERVMELQFDYDETNYKEIEAEVQQKEEALQAEVEPIFEHYDDTTATSAQLEIIKNYYLQNRYLARLRENMQKLI